MNEYETQANLFLIKTGTTMEVKFVEYAKYDADDKDSRDIYQITMIRGDRRIVFKFGQSIAHSGRFKYMNHVANDMKALSKLAGRTLAKGECIENKEQCEPNAYDVLACLTKYDPESFENFCSEYGYDTDSRKAEKIYNAVVEEYKNLCYLYNDEEMEELREIQ